MSSSPPTGGLTEGARPQAGLFFYAFKLPALIFPPVKKRPFGFAQGFQLSLWLPPIGYALLIFSLSSIKYASVPDVKFHLFDKMIHLCEYGAFGFILAWSFARLGWKNPYLWAALIASMYGATDELHQYYVPGRTMEFLDWVADTLGGITGSQIYRLWRKKFNKLPTN